MNQQYDVVIVGAGFTGLTAGLALSRAGRKVLIVEKDATPGGLAGTFQFRDGVTIEKFYHHWFNNDEYVPRLVKELGLEGEIVTLPSRTGMYFSGKMWRLSTPLDLLKFTPLSLIDRIRLGLLVFKVRKIKDWRSIEHLTIREWLEPLCGKTVYRVVWQPLIDAKFSVFAEAINAVWFWKKLVLRGSTRDKSGGEQLAYFRGGFGRLAEAMSKEIVKLGGEVRYNTGVRGAKATNGQIEALQLDGEDVVGRQYLFTPAFPVIANILDPVANGDWTKSLRRVNYLGNMCLVLEMDRSLSDTYWLNVNDPGFPFVGVIEHTNFDPPANYAGNHIVFLSRYIATADPVWKYDDEKYLSYALEHLKRMFPEMQRSWIKEFRLWRADYAQPVTEKDYSSYVPGRKTPFSNALISTMAQIYPEDRGTNYAIREGEEVAEMINGELGDSYRIS
ncbi:NAD(P)/FAD-dependent oxidoreductase [Paraburkholderia edwinii]|uniref:NAD(P)/FAD-dependent oxidoreductase n=1 Tax=Paraburkholderia edwinii TaxID=2861782 RepID=A0ABX8UKK3_9BURK|nr:NAD(P)/FAD-dependent oxidoreductase [Paraburkholderia edwinii]QYD67857.1 NAD(P)/FAD-dependent oxidoreductase [Paraburkholderia edwinii]